ncbi:hypothetical protein A6V39_00185 [Candidatus Mycoplasma haematobovis]|uniref:Uncharacterized protein n=1 Tax=Candidatus Mycoplasma haematobovis TaxID=432608 RepID=A0A1A9QDB7_9MOLU|nr:hypothetical protein [Candidatus Mycoplasma haematobovis]OAL10467.1 hypothetical protein A6V39_00185 [Candidatus Mycoplasma haematobovis]
MNISVKVLSAGAGLGLVGGAGVTAHYLLNDNSIGKALKDKGHTLLNFDITNTQDKATWDPIVKAYVSSNKKINDVTIVITPSDGTPTQDNVNGLKKACAKVIESKNNNETTLQNAEQFCVTPITVKSLVEKQRTVLDSTASTNETPTEWNNLVTSYLNASTDKQISGVTLAQNNPSDESGKRDALKRGCEGIKNTKTHDTNYHKQYEQFVNWCSVPKKIMA